VARTVEPDGADVSKGFDLAASLVCSLLGVGVCIEAGRLGFGSVFAPEPGFFPWIGGLMMVGLSACLFFQALRSRAAPPPSASEWLRPALLLAALALYVTLLEPLGYPLTTTGLCVVALRILRTRRWSVTVGVSLALALGTFILFTRGLGVELPAGSLFFRG
jgi:putative tricarboxylic transport membrane protein